MITPNPNGVTVNFYNADGSQDETQTYTGQAVLYTADRPPSSSVGSTQWLSTVYLAQNAARLAQLQTDVPYTGSPVCGTSGSSCQTTLVIDRPAGTETIRNAWVIALSAGGQQPIAGTPYVTDTLHVSAAGGFDQPSNPQHANWKKMTLFVATQSA